MKVEAYPKELDNYMSAHGETWKVRCERISHVVKNTKTVAVRGIGKFHTYVTPDLLFFAWYVWDAPRPKNTNSVFPHGPRF
jgi:hypothetical protein